MSKVLNIRKFLQSICGMVYLLSLSLFMRSTAPGLGYGRCWNKGPEAVTSAPVLAESHVSSPADHEPLRTQHTSTSSIHMPIVRIMPSFWYGE